MRTKKQLEKDGVEYKEYKFRWIRADYRLETYEFSEELLSLSYLEYLEKWKQRLDDYGEENFEIISKMRADNKEITLVEILEPKEVA